MLFDTEGKLLLLEKKILKKKTKLKPLVVLIKPEYNRLFYSFIFIKQYQSVCYQHLISCHCCLISGNLGVAALRLLNRFSFQAVANAFFSVDSFFFLRYILNKCLRHLNLQSWTIDMIN